MEIRVRRAETGDLDGIEELYGRAGDAEEGRLDGSRWKRGVYPLRQDAQEGLEAGALYIAELDGQIAGSVILRREQDSAYRQASWQIPFEAPVFVVHTLAVDPAYRHRGVGRALLRHAAKVGREAGLQAIRLDVYEENRTAIGFYEACGYHCCGCIDLGLEEVYGSSGTMPMKSCSEAGFFAENFEKWLASGTGLCYYITAYYDRRGQNGVCGV